MKWMILLLALAATSICPAQTSRIAAAKKEAFIVVSGRTIVAFFAPVTNAEMQKEPDTGEALADFQLYARQVREPLKKAGIEFHELYARSFRFRVGKVVTTFRASKDVGYFLIAPGRKPRIEYGVMTDADLVRVANQYFGGPTE